MKQILHLPLFLLFHFFAGNCFSQQIVGVTPFVAGINQPIDLKHCGDDRLFVADRSGKIRVINADTTLRPIPFLDITAKISSATNSEEGFLGFTFTPAYKTDGKFYVNYTTYIGSQLTSIVEEYKVSADSNVADASSALKILSVDQPYSNHNGGNMMFGKDGFLYIDFGDGGNGGDPLGNGQNKTTFLAKILRIDIRNSSAAEPYINPPTNPFYNDATPGIKKEIWAYGVRNPWRSSFDKLNGDLWIADVGQSNREEIDYQGANSTGGQNYGWNIMEGTACYQPASGCSSAGLTMPLYNYSHSTGQSITGGYVCRSAQSKALFGTYIFADYVQKWVDGLKQNGGVLSGSVTRFITTAAATGNPVSFGEDRFGDLYILFNNDNTVYRIADTSRTRKPIAYFTVSSQNGGSNYFLQGLQGHNFSYQWLKDNAPIPFATLPDYTINSPGTYTLKVTNLLNTSDTSAAFVFGVLPVSFVNFTAQRQSLNAVQLAWQTASEQNSNGFVLQRRTAMEADFRDISFIASAALNGNSSALLSYDFMDLNAPVSQKLFYRLQIKNQYGSFYYSDVRFINNHAGEKGFSIYPNPANNQATVFLEEYLQPKQLTIFDEFGRRVKVEQLRSSTNTIQLKGLKGTYILQVSDANGENIQRKKLIVL